MCDCQKYRTQQPALGDLDKPVVNGSRAQLTLLGLTGTMLKMQGLVKPEWHDFSCDGLWVVIQQGAKSVIVHMATKQQLMSACSGTILTDLPGWFRAGDPTTFWLFVDKSTVLGHRLSLDEARAAYAKGERSPYFLGKSASVRLTNADVYGEEDKGINLPDVIGKGWDELKGVALIGVLGLIGYGIVTRF